MTRPELEQAVDLLIKQVWEAIGASRFATAVSAAGRAVEGADRVGDPSLLVRALVVEAYALRLSSDYPGALVRCTRILAMAQDPDVTSRLNDRAVMAVAGAYIEWVQVARFAGGFRARRLFDVLDAADHWLTVTGHSDWRAGLLLQRAQLHRRLEEWDQAVAAAEEALVAYNPNAPGRTLATHHVQLGQILCEAGRNGEAIPHFSAVLDAADSTLVEQSYAWGGLAECVLAEGDMDAAIRHATTSVRISEPLGDDYVAGALEILANVYRARGEVDAAWVAAIRGLESARRVANHYRMYHSLLPAVDAALDRVDLVTARRLLDELEQHAAALDTDADTVTFTGKAAKRRQRLAPVQPEDVQPDD